VGRHSSGARGPYMRSVVGWAFPWILIAAVLIAAVWFLVNAVGGREIAFENGNPSRTSSPNDEATPTPSESPTPKPSRPKSSPAPTRSPKGDEDDLITDGVTVQVVNGTGGIEGAASSMADRLASLGYRVEAIVTGLTVDQTAVYWSTDSAREAAMALASHFGWTSAPASPSLTREVDIHVIVAPDEA
jgi:LytR cell envelope-related transcriptional attenuator